MTVSWIFLLSHVLLKVGQKETVHLLAKNNGIQVVFA